MSTTTKAAPADLARLMRHAQRVAGGGRVSVALSEAGTFTASAYRTAEAAQRVAVQATRQAEPGSLGLDSFTTAVERAAGQIIAYGRGKEPLGALSSMVQDLAKRGAEVPE